MQYNINDVPMNRRIDHEQRRTAHDKIQGFI